MSQAEHDRRVDYIEFHATDLAATKRFYSSVFGWKFSDWGDEYTSFEDGRLSGGFAKRDQVQRGGPLVVVYARDLAEVERAVKEQGGEIVEAAYEFPGGRRFLFADPNGNVLAVWSER